MHDLRSPLTPIYDDDPAFSSDPHAHPFFAAQMPWSLRPDDDARLLPRPALPMFSDDHSSTTHETASSSASSSNHTSTTLSSPPTSADSHSSPWTPDKASHLRWPPDAQKKKKNIAMFWRRTPPETVLASVDLARNVSPSPSPPPPRNMTPTPRPPPARVATAQQPFVATNRPNLTPRSATATADFKPPPLAARRVAGVLALRGNELDRIDELDETNPAGLPLHHNGPYEAAHQPTSQDPAAEPKVPHNIGSQYQPSHRRNVSDITSVPIVPAGVSLNLSPGQVLPHNFYYQLDQTMMPPVAPLNAPGWPPQPQPQSRPKTRSHSQPQLQPQSQPRSRAHAQPPPQTQTQTQTQPYPAFHQNTYHANYDQERPVEHPPVVHDNKHARLDGSQQSSRPRNSPPEYSSLPASDYVSKGDMKKAPLHFSTPLSNFKGEENLAYDIAYTKGDHKRSVKEQQLYPVSPINIQSDFRINTPAPRHHQQINRLPPRMQALQMQVPRSDEKHRRSPRPPNVPPDFAAPGQVGHRRRSQTPQPQMVDHNQPLFIDNNGFPASAPAPPSFDILQSIRDPIQPGAVSHPLHVHDQGPSARSVHSSSKSTQSGTSKGAPPPHHVPKRLIMPAPLQTSQPIAPRHQPQPPVGPHYLEQYDWQPQMRPPSPPIVPSALDPYIESQLRAEDMQMAQSRSKLRKRSSAQAAPLPPPAHSLSFQPTPLYNDVLSSQQFSSSRKPEKPQKKLLSKRRIDF
ncbi:hypothetical protein H0H87_004502 [Tephrocybe sp. NHM501043]|nr:hypothetical protein H0H87_004502 [Tephrocybe sp. NHM501043]